MSHQKRKGGWAGESVAQESEREDECLVPAEPPGGLVMFSEDRRLSGWHLGNCPGGDGFTALSLDLEIWRCVHRPVGFTIFTFSLIISRLVLATSGAQARLLSCPPLSLSSLPTAVCLTGGSQTPALVSLSSLDADSMVTGTVLG